MTKDELRSKTGAEIGSDGKKSSLSNGDQGINNPNGRNVESESSGGQTNLGSPKDARESPKVAQRGLSRKDTGAIFTPKVSNYGRLKSELEDVVIEEDDESQGSVSNLGGDS
jgi:hypothetical protein